MSPVYFLVKLFHVREEFTKDRVVVRVFDGVGLLHSMSPQALVGGRGTVVMDIVDRVKENVTVALVLHDRVMVVTSMVMVQKGIAPTTSAIGAIVPRLKSMTEKKRTFILHFLRFIHFIDRDVPFPPPSLLCFK